MFFLRVHSVDSNHPLPLGEATFSTTNRANPNPSRYSERRGVVHLYRSASQSSLPSQNPSSRSTSLFVVAVPNYLSPDDLVRFFFFGPNSYADHLHHLLFIRNDGMEDRYSVLVEFDDQVKADAFYRSFNGERFSPAEAELCHILFLISVEYTELGDIASIPPDGCTELPTCPICLERLDPDTSGIRSTLCDHSFRCTCPSKWTYLSCQVCRLCQQQDEKPACSICETQENLWVCLICGFVGCGRYKEGHGVRHWKDTKHCYSLDLRTQQIWDYVGDNYVHRLNQSKTDGKLVGLNPHCASLEGECGTCEYIEDSGIGGAIFSSKVEAIVDEYGHLLATQLETQRQHYESLITEAKSKRESGIAEAVEKAVNSTVQDIQNQLETCEQEKNVVADTNGNLIKEQEALRKRYNDIEERLTSSLHLKDEMIADLEEQLRDLTIYIEAQRTLVDMADVQGGTVLPVSLNPSSSPANNKRHTKPGRRRK